MSLLTGVEANGLCSRKRCLRRKAGVLQERAVRGSHSGFRQWVEHLQHCPLVRVTDGGPRTQVSVPVLPWRRLRGGATDLQWGCVRPSEVPGPVQGVRALGQPGAIHQVRVLEKAPEGVLAITQEGGRHLWSGLLVAISLGAHWLWKERAPVGPVGRGVVAAEATAGQVLEELAVGLQNLQVEGSGGRLLPPRRHLGHKRRDPHEGRRGPRRGVVWRWLPFSTFPRRKRSRFGNRRGCHRRRGFEARLWGPDCKMDSLLPGLFFRRRWLERGRTQRVREEPAWGARAAALSVSQELRAATWTF